MTKKTEAEQCMNPYCESPGTVKLQVFANDIGLACDVCAHFPHAYWIKRNGEPNARIAQDLENRSRNRPNHLLEEQLDRAIHFACHESDWNWKAEEGVPSPYDAMLPIVLAVFEAIDPVVTKVDNRHEDMSERVAHLLWMIQPTQMPLDWMEAGRPTPQEICDYVTSALQAKAGAAYDPDATEMRKALPDFDVPDFDAADAALNAAMTEQNARLEAEEKIANVQSWLDQVLAEYDFSKGIFGEHSWRYSAGVLADLLHHVLHNRIGGYEPVVPEVDSDA